MAITGNWHSTQTSHRCLSAFLPTFHEPSPSKRISVEDRGIMLGPRITFDVQASQFDDTHGSCQRLFFGGHGDATERTPPTRCTSVEGMT